MALRQTKKISELPALTPATLDTTFVVGISGSTTYKISINQLTSSLDSAFATDLVTTALSGTLDGKLSTSSFNSYTASISTGSLVTSISNLNIFTASVSTASLVTSITNINNATSSYELKGSGILSGSISYMSLTNIPQGIVSQSTDLSSLNTFTASISTASLVTSIENLNTFTASQSTSSLVDRLNVIENVSGSWITESETGSLQTSITNLNTFTASVSTASLVTSISNLNSATSSYLTSLSGAISSSSQLTSSYDIRYVISGSVGATPLGTISGSAQITAFGFVSGSYETTGRGIISSSANLVTTSSYNADSASFDTRINSITVSSGSNLTYFIEAYANVTYTLPGGFTEDPCRYSVVSATENVPSNWFNTSTYTFTPQKAGYWEINAAYDVYRNGEASMAIKKNGSIVAAAGSFNAVAQDISKTVYLNGSTDYINIINVGGAALQRDQYQSRSWFQAKFVGVVSGSTDLLSANNTFTGNNTFNGITRFETVGGDEGGEIQFGVPTTNTTLQNRVTVDVWQNRLRIFEGSANANGVYIDLSKPITGNNNEITYKASGIVNAGTFVTLDNIKATVTTSGQRGLSLATVSGTIAINMAGNYAGSGVGVGGSSGTASITTSASTSLFGWGFTATGDFANYIITDTTNSRAYRIIIQIGASFNNNLVSIERLH
jgi:hypothetical protein